MPSICRPEAASSGLGRRTAPDQRAGHVHGWSHCSRGSAPPEQLADDILAKERRIIEIMEEIKSELAGETT